jgi:hypothetical protein
MPEITDALITNVGVVGGLAVGYMSVAVARDLQRRTFGRR